MTTCTISLDELILKNTEYFWNSEYVGKFGIPKRSGIFSNQLFLKQGWLILKLVPTTGFIGLYYKLS